jgi:hypothetical protein
MTETGGGTRDNEQYAFDDGGSTTGDTYSYGDDASTERALGGLQSGTLVPSFGASFTNTTGQNVTSVTINYTGEQWRLGQAGRTDRLDFQYSTDATSLTTGTWTDVNTLDFTAPITGPTVGALDGNAAANRTTIGPIVISGINLSNGSAIWIRWNDLNATGSDDGLAVDDFSITLNGQGVQSPSIANATAAMAGVYTLTVTGSACALTANTTVAVSGTTTTADAGDDQSICTTDASATLNGNDPSEGTGTWSVESGPSTNATQFGDVNTFNTTFTPDGGAGTYTLRWTISNPPCTDSYDEVDIIVVSPPTTADAGDDQSICTTDVSATLDGNDPSEGTGTWSVESGPSTNASQFGNVNTYNTTFTPDGGAGTYTLRWTISNPPCTDSYDEVDITVAASPTTSNAGSNQTICVGNSATLAANDPVVGTGTWSVVSGPSTDPLQFDDVNVYNTDFTPASGVGTYKLKWTISNPPCTASTSTVDIVVIQTPAMPGTITGPASPCENTTITYSISAVTYATQYNWSVPAGWSIVSGQNTTSINVSVAVGALAGNISVTAGNICGTSAPKTKAVTVKLATTITGHFINSAPATNITIVYGCTTPELSVTATGQGTLTYRWFKNATNSNTGGTAVTFPSTNPSYTVPPASPVGTYYFYVEVTGQCGTVKSNVFTVVIQQQEADAENDGKLYYTGPCMAWTPTATSNTATVTLTAFVKNSSKPGAECGDIATALITFQVKNSTGWTDIPSAQNLPVYYVDPNNPSKGGTANAIVQLNISNNTATQIFELRVVVGGNYTAKPDCGQAQITVSKLIPGGSISGGVLLCGTNASGLLKPATSILTPSLLGFGVEYTTQGKQVKNPKGKVNLYVPSFFTFEGVNTFPHLNWYKISSNAIASLAINSPKATFSGKANVARYNPLTGETIPIEGNCTMVLDVEDWCQTGWSNTQDKVGITIYRNNGGNWYSNNWVTSKTVPTTICLGDLTVTGTTVTPPPISSPLTRSVMEQAPQVLPFNVKAYPNPTEHQFTLQLDGSTDERISVTVYDMAGKQVKKVERGGGPAPIRFGEDLKVGAYIVEVRQGVNRKTIKLVKQ